LPFLFKAASSSFSDLIFRSGEDCRHFNFNSYSGIAQSVRTHYEKLARPDASDRAYIRCWASVRTDSLVEDAVCSELFSARNLAVLMHMCGFFIWWLKKQIFA
jgi:hypothetical protein